MSLVNPGRFLKVFRNNTGRNGTDRRNLRKELPQPQNLEKNFRRILERHSKNPERLKTYKEHGKTPEENNEITIKFH